MSEFKIHHLVNELLKSLGVSEKNGEGVSSDSYVEYLLRNRTQYVTTRITSSAAIRSLISHSPDPSAAAEKYEDLKEKNFREIDALVCLLSEMSSDSAVKNILEKNSQNGLEPKSSYSDFNGTLTNGKLSEKELKMQKFELQQRVTSGFNEQQKIPAKQRTVPDGIYKFPSWVKERPHMSWDFVPEPRIDNVEVGPICKLPKSVQETLLITDILFCFSGIDGDYIITEELKDPCAVRTFKVDQSTDPSLLELTKRILPLASDYSMIIRFVEEKSNFEYGLVNHALCAAMRHSLRDYFILIAQLENQHLNHSLSLQKIWYYIQPFMNKLQTIASIANILNKGDCFGGEVLSVLHDKAYTLTGDSVGREICLHLAEQASVPYFEILEKWIYKGIISDPYSEFLVEDNDLFKKDDLPEYSNDYWEKRYVIRREQIPRFLEKVASRILKTGKYLNVIRQCGQSIKCPNAKPLTYVAREQIYFDMMDNAYQFASKKLLDLLMENNDLMGRLRSVKHYFLLDQGDFIVQFMDMAETELSKDIDNIMPTRLAALLEMALRTSVINSDKYKDDIKIELLNEDLKTQLFKILMISPEDQEEYGTSPDIPITGLEAFAFTYEIKWPLSLVINHSALTCYQLLFRHLFYCKHVENLLGRVWTLNKVTKIYPLTVSASYASAFSLCQRMLNFIQNLDYYITLEVIEPHWQVFLEKMGKVSNVDEVLVCHKGFLDDCLKDCMLMSPDLLQILVKINKLCVTVSHFMQETHAFEVEYCGMGDGMLVNMFEETTYRRRRNVGETSVEFQKSFQDKISDFQKQFDSLFDNLLDSISGQMIKSSTKMINMLYRLDFDRFHTRSQDSKLPN